MEVRAAFEQLDTSSDGYITVPEIQQRLELDDDGDGEVREERERGEGEGDVCFVGLRSPLKRLWPTWTTRSLWISLSS